MFILSSVDVGLPWTRQKAAVLGPGGWTAREATSSFSVTTRLLWLDHQEWLAGGDALALAAQHAQDSTRTRRGDADLHLHRLEHDQRVALGDALALAHQHLPDAARHVRGHALASRVDV